MRITTFTALGAIAVLGTAACTINPPVAQAPTPVVVQAPPMQQPASTVIVPRGY